MTETFIQGKELGIVGCTTCRLVVRIDAENTYCPRCNTHLQFRKTDSVIRTWALLISALVMYVPANTQPVMRTSYLGVESADTILGGVIYFFQQGDWPLAFIVFIASIIIPILKMMSLAYLLVTVQRRSIVRKKQRTRLFRIIEIIGRWSMVDVFVVALMTALVHVGTLVNIIPGVGALAFSLVVILSMLAVMTFDPRSIWDH